MTEREHIRTSEQLGGDPLPASLAYVIACRQCDSCAWCALILDETSLVYRCRDCEALVRFTYDAASGSWTVVAL